jgi:hypothetical protein
MGIYLTIRAGRYVAGLKHLELCRDSIKQLRILTA